MFGGSEFVHPTSSRCGARTFGFCFCCTNRNSSELIHARINRGFSVLLQHKMSSSCASKGAWEQPAWLYKNTSMYVWCVVCCSSTLTLPAVSGHTAVACLLQTVNQNTGWETKKVGEDSCMHRCKISQGAKDNCLDRSASSWGQLTFVAESVQKK